MGRLIKWLFYLIILAVILLAAYTYVGPILGVDFSAQSERTTVPVILTLD